MIRGTLDVNVLASGLLTGAGSPADLIEAWTNFTYELVISKYILEGLERTWRRPYYQRRFDSERVSRGLRSLRVQATIVAPVTTVHGVAEDVEDDLPTYDYDEQIFGCHELQRSFFQKTRRLEQRLPSQTIFLIRKGRKI